MGEVSLNRGHRLEVFRTTPGLVLGALLAVVIVTAAACQRDVKALTAPEMTCLLAAQSLARDFDLQFADEDRQRLESFSFAEEDLQLRRSPIDDGMMFDVPLAYPLVIAPLARLAPIRGPLVVNGLLMLLAALVASYRLSRRLGRAGLAVVALGLFASVMYRNVFLVQPTLMLAALVAAAFSLAFSHEEPAAHGLTEVYRPAESATGVGGRSVLAGLLLGVVATHHPVYLILTLPAAFALPDDRRKSGVVGLAAGVALILAASFLMGGFWSGSTGGLLTELGAELENLSVGLVSWNLLYLTVGRNTGLLPYFLPLVALLGLWQGGTRRSVLVVTAAVGILASLVLSPFNYFNGPAAVGNSWLIPWFVLLWFVPTRPLPRGWLMATVLIAVPAMYPTWLATHIEPITENGVFRQAAGPLHRWLPLETSQKELPPSGEAVGDRLWIRSLSNEAVVSGASRWRLKGAGWVEMQLATPVALEAVYLQFGSQAEPQLEIRGGVLGDMVLLADGGIGFRVEELSRKALHPMWWNPEKHHNYVVQLKMPMAEPRPQTLVVTAIAEDLDRAPP